MKSANYPRCSGKVPPYIARWHLRARRRRKDYSDERVRIISGTNKDLNREVTAGRFRQDLFYRLCVIPLALPPLRDRKSDISLLIDYFFARYADTGTKNKVDISPETLEIFTSYHWPGNVCELQNVIQFALINSRGNRIESRHLPPHLTFSLPFQLPVKKRRKLDPAEVSEALAQASGNKQDAAKLLGVSRATLYHFFDQQEKFFKESP